MTFLELFDAPDACDAYRRTTSVVPQQALALVNNAMLLDLSRGWPPGSGPRSEAASSTASRRSSRPPSSRSWPAPRPLASGRSAAAFLAKQAALFAQAPAPPSGGSDPAPGRGMTWSTPCSATTISSPIH